MWDCSEMPVLSREVVNLRLQLQQGKKPLKQIPRRFMPEIPPKFNSKQDEEKWSEDGRCSAR